MPNQSSVIYLYLEYLITKHKKRHVDKKRWPYQISVICITMWYDVYIHYNNERTKGSPPRKQ